MSVHFRRHLLGSQIGDGEGPCLGAVESPKLELLTVKFMAQQARCHIYPGEIITEPKNRNLESYRAHRAVEKESVGVSSQRCSKIEPRRSRR